MGLVDAGVQYGDLDPGAVEPGLPGRRGADLRDTPVQGRLAPAVQPYPGDARCRRPGSVPRWPAAVSASQTSAESRLGAVSASPETAGRLRRTRMSAADMAASAAGRPFLAYETIRGTVPRCASS